MLQSICSVKRTAPNDSDFKSPYNGFIWFASIINNHTIDGLYVKSAIEYDIAEYFAIKLLFIDVNL